VEVRDVQGRIVASLSIAEVLDHPLHPAFQQSCAELPRSGSRQAARFKVPAEAEAMLPNAVPKKLII